MFITIQCNIPVVQVIPPHFCDCPGLVRYCHMSCRVLGSPSASPELSQVWETFFISCFLKKSGFGCYFLGRYGSTADSPKISIEKQQRSGIWLMRAHQKHWGRRHWSAISISYKKENKPFFLPYVLRTENRQLKWRKRNWDEAQQGTEQLEINVNEVYSISSLATLKTKQTKKVPLIWCKRSQFCVRNGHHDILRYLLHLSSVISMFIIIGELYFCINSNEVIMVSYWWTWKEKMV